MNRMTKALTNATRLAVPEGLTRGEIDEWLRDAQMEQEVDGIAAYVWRVGEFVAGWVSATDVAQARQSSMSAEVE